MTKDLKIRLSNELSGALDQIDGYQQLINQAMEKINIHKARIRTVQAILQRESESTISKISEVEMGMPQQKGRAKYE